ncbi:hypothetical protein CJJ17_23635 [Gordonia polyisoprenivorans]|nr:hypothetical protein CJJ17_23635 [Gordonia polyisoprenivorans]
MLPDSGDQWRADHDKAVAAYGASVDDKPDRATDDLLSRPESLTTCMTELQMTTVAEDELRSRLAALQSR